MSATTTKTETDLPVLITTENGQITKLEIIDKRSELFHKVESARKENSKLAKIIHSQRKKIRGLRERKNDAERLLRRIAEETSNANLGEEIDLFLSYTDKRKPVETK